MVKFLEVKIISINEFSETPIYIQIRDQIVLGISDGRISPGEQLPTVRNLATEIGINTMTVSKAYQLLKQEGYVVTDRRSGARVSNDFQKSNGIGKENELTLRRIASEAKIKGMTEQEFLNICIKAYEGEKI